MLGFSYHDLMARLMTAGPDDAWQRLQEICRVVRRDAGGGRIPRVLQGSAHGARCRAATSPAASGSTRSSSRAILVPQVMLYGFLGFHPTADGFAVNPRLPKEWPELTITRIHLHGSVIDINVRDNTVTVTGSGRADEPLTAALPQGWQVSSTPVGLCQEQITMISAIAFVAIAACGASTNDVQSNLVWAEHAFPTESGNAQITCPFSFAYGGQPSYKLLPSWERRVEG